MARSDITPPPAEDRGFRQRYGLTPEHTPEHQAGCETVVTLRSSIAVLTAACFVLAGCSMFPEKSKIVHKAGAFDQMRYPEVEDMGNKQIRELAELVRVTCKGAQAYADADRLSAIMEAEQKRKLNPTKKNVKVRNEKRDAELDATCKSLHETLRITARSLAPDARSGSTP